MDTAVKIWLKKITKINFGKINLGKLEDALCLLEEQGNIECKHQNDEISLKEVYLEKRQAELASSEFIKVFFISKSKVLDADLVYYLPDLFDERLYK